MNVASFLEFDVLIWLHHATDKFLVHSVLFADYNQFARRVMSSNGPYNYSYIFKYIIIGDMGVGKSCLLHQFTEKKCMFLFYFSMNCRMNSLLDYDVCQMPFGLSCSRFIEDLDLDYDFCFLLYNFIIEL